MNQSVIDRINEGGRFVASQVVELTGVTYRQLDYWCNIGALGEDYKHPASGRAREFTAESVRLLFYAVSLRKKGFTRALALRVAAEMVEAGLTAPVEPTVSVSVPS